MKIEKDDTSFSMVGIPITVEEDLYLGPIVGPDGCDIVIGGNDKTKVDIYTKSAINTLLKDILISTEQQQELDEAKIEGRIALIEELQLNIAELLSKSKSKMTLGAKIVLRLSTYEEVTNKNQLMIHGIIEGETINVN